MAKTDLVPVGRTYFERPDVVRAHDRLRTAGVAAEIDEVNVLAGPGGPGRKGWVLLVARDDVRRAHQALAKGAGK